MSKRRLLLLLIAAFVGMGTILVARSLMAPPPQVAATAQVETTQVLAASRNLPIGSVLRDSDMKWIPWPSEADTAQFFKQGRDDMGRLNGAVLREGLRAGEPFLTGQVVQPHDHGFLAAILAPGKRAMTITLSPSAEVAGFIFPGDHVDVILTHSFSRKDMSDVTERRVSETVLQDVRVLALDQKSDAMSADPKVATLATLEVDPKQAEKLALASELAGANSQAHGVITLALRSLANDDQAAQTDANGHPLPAPPADTLTNTTTWDSDVSPAYPGVGGSGDSLMQRVHIMRGKESTDSNFERKR